MRKIVISFLLVILSGSSVIGGSGSMAFGQSWSGVCATSRCIDWSVAGLPATLPDGETTANPWTPPVRSTQCVTAQCNTVSSGTTVTAASITSAINSAPQGTVVVVPAGTFALGGNITITHNYATLRGAGANSTKLTGGSIIIGGGAGSGTSNTLLTANASAGATTVTVSSPPTAGRLVSLAQCDTGFSASGSNFMTFGSGTSCTGSYSDPSGPWVCGQTGTTPTCNRGEGGSINNPHYQSHVQWIPSGGVSGNTVTLSTPLDMPWSTARSAAMGWLGTTTTVGVGIEGLRITGSISLANSYANWVKGVHILGTSGTRFDNQWDAHSLLANSYITNTTANNEIIELANESGERQASNFLMINNIVEGGFQEQRSLNGSVLAYNFYRAAQPGWVENGEFTHSAGSSHLLREGYQGGNSLDDETWGTHNFNGWFRVFSNCTDPAYPSLAGSFPIEVGGWSRFSFVIGSVISGGACTNSYSEMIYVNRLGLESNGLTAASFMNWGNYITCSGDARCNTSSFLSSGVPSNLASYGANSTPYQNSVPASNNLPASFFMNSMTAHPSGGTGLSWWKVCTAWTSFPTSCLSTSTPPMPPIGPDVTGGPFNSGHAYNIPAALAYSALPSDSALTTSWGTNLKQFDERAFQLDSSTAPQIPAPSPGLMLTKVF